MGSGDQNERIGADFDWGAGYATAWRCFLATLCIPAVLVLASCGARNDGTEVRYRITVEVDTPEGLHTGSSVWSFQLRPGNLDHSYNSRFRGEAVAVDLPRGRTMFAILVGRRANGDPASGEMQTLPERVLRRAGVIAQYEQKVVGDRKKTLRFIANLPPQTITLDCGAMGPSECPLLVYFRDIGDPGSVRAIDPKDLAGTFGEGVRLRRIVFETTGKSPEFELEKRLPWLNAAGERSLEAGHSARDYSLPALLHINDFQRK